MPGMRAAFLPVRRPEGATAANMWSSHVEDASVILVRAVQVQAVSRLISGLMIRCSGLGARCLPNSGRVRWEVLLVELVAAVSETSR